MATRHDLLFRFVAGPQFSLLESLAKQSLSCFYYHVVGDEGIPHVAQLYRYKTVAAFIQDLEYLVKKYKPVSMTDVIENLTRDRPLPRNAFLLTFDDGYREMIDVVAPLLLRWGVNATFFMNSGFIDNSAMCYLNKASLLVERLRDTAWSGGLARRITEILGPGVDAAADANARVLSIGYAERSRLDELAAILELDFAASLNTKQPYLSSAQVRKLIELGFSVGAHSIDHPLYALIPLEEQLRQTTESAVRIRRLFNLDYGVFAFPHSDVGVGREFFVKLAETGLIDVSFGTSGLLDDTVPYNLQRVSLEQPLAPAEQIVRFHHARRLMRVLTGRARMARS